MQCHTFFWGGWCVRKIQKTALIRTFTTQNIINLRPLDAEAGGALLSDDATFDFRSKQRRGLLVRQSKFLFTARIKCCGKQPACSLQHLGPSSWPTNGGSGVSLVDSCPYSTCEKQDIAASMLIHSAINVVRLGISRCSSDFLFHCCQ